MQLAVVAMPGFNLQEEDEVKLAFQEWKKRWNKDYPTPDEENARFQDFKENFLAQLVNNPSMEPLWKVLNRYADRPEKEHFGYIRLDGFNPQEEDEFKLAFQAWKKKWNKDYPTPDEEKARFQDFKENFLSQRVNPSMEPLWKVLDEHADRPEKEHFGYIRLDRTVIGDSSDDEPDAHHLCYIPVKQEDGTIRCLPFLLDDPFAIQFRRDAIENRSAMPLVKRSSDDKDEDGTVKR